MRHLNFTALAATLIFSTVSCSSGKASDSGPRSFGEADYQTLVSLNRDQNTFYEAAREAYANPVTPLTASESAGGDQAVSPVPDTKQKIIESLKFRCASYSTPLPSDPPPGVRWNSAWLVTSEPASGLNCPVELYQEWSYDTDTDAVTFDKYLRTIEGSQMGSVTPLNNVALVGLVSAQRNGSEVGVTGKIEGTIQSGPTVLHFTITTDQKYVDRVGGGSILINMDRGVPNATAELKWTVNAFQNPRSFEYFLNGQPIERKKFFDAFSAIELEQLAIYTSRLRH